MQRRRIGSLEVSVVGLGTNNFGSRLDAEQSAQVLHSALDAGINLIDTADVYGGNKSEEYIGRALGERRDEAVLTTKFGLNPNGPSEGQGRPEYVHKALEDSLQRLATDRIDLYLLHRPDPTTPIGETLGALQEAVAAGKVRELGCSNFSAAMLEEAEAAAGGGSHFVNVQNRYSLLNREPEADVLPTCERLGIGFVPYSPLAGGFLTGKFHRGETPPEGTRIANMDAARRGEVLSDTNFTIIERLEALAEANGHSMLELAISYLLAHPAVSSVIAGASNKAQIDANVAAGGWQIPPDVLAEIEAIAG